MNKKIKKVALSALFAAMITALTFFIKIPMGYGYFHIGDSVIYLAACILPTPYALMAAGIGGALADALGGYFIYIIPSMIIKMLITLPYNAKSDVILTKRNIIMIIPASIITIVGYFGTAFVFYGWSGAFAGLFGDIIQVVGSAVLFIIITCALDKINIKNMLS